MQLINDLSILIIWIILIILIILIISIILIILINLIFLIILLSMHLIFKSCPSSTKFCDQLTTSFHCTSICQ